MMSCSRVATHCAHRAIVHACARGVSPFRLGKKSRGLLRNGGYWADTVPNVLVRFESAVIPTCVTLFSCYSEELPKLLSWSVTVHGLAKLFPRVADSMTRGNSSGQYMAILVLRRNNIDRSECSSDTPAMKTVGGPNLERHTCSSQGKVNTLSGIGCPRAAFTRAA